MVVGVEKAESWVMPWFAICRCVDRERALGCWRLCHADEVDEMMQHGEGLHKERSKARKWVVYGDKRQLQGD